MSNKTQLQENNVKLQNLLNTINALPDPIPDDLGNATTDKVLKGYTFSSNNGIKLTGNMVLPIGLHLGNPPTKTVYQYNEPLTIEGMTVILKVWDGTQNIETDVTEDCTFTPEVGTLMTTVGFNQLKATYEYNGLTYTVIQDLEVENTLQSIAVTTMPTKTEYTLSQGLDITGLVVTATYATGATADVTNFCTFVPAVGETLGGVGEKVVSVSYTENSVEKSTEFTVLVKGVLSYYGKAADLQASRSMISGATAGNYAVLVSGNNNPAVDAYSDTLVKTPVQSLSSSDYNAGPTELGNKAIIFNGEGSPGTTAYVYNENLVYSRPNVLSEARGDGGAATIGNHAIYAGGMNYSSVFLDVVDAVNEEMVSTTLTALSVKRALIHGASAGSKYAIFAGGWTRPRAGSNSYYNTCDAYSAELVKANVTALANKTSDAIGESVGIYAIFITGTLAEVYTDELVKTTATSSTVNMNDGTSTRLGDYAIYMSMMGRVPSINSYNYELVRGVVANSIEDEMYEPGAATVGDYALFASNVYVHALTLS